MPRQLRYEARSRGKSVSTLARSGRAARPSFRTVRLLRSALAQVGICQFFRYSSNAVILARHAPHRSGAHVRQLTVDVIGAEARVCRNVIITRSCPPSALFGNSGDVWLCGHAWYPRIPLSVVQELQQPLCSLAAPSSAVISTTRRPARGCETVGTLLASLASVSAPSVFSRKQPHDTPERGVQKRCSALRFRALLFTGFAGASVPSPKTRR